MTPTPLLTRQSSSILEVEADLRSYFATQTNTSAIYGPTLTRLWGVAASRILGGKLVRPRLFLNMFHALGGYTASNSGVDSTVQQDAAHIATAIELLHYSFLLHDDVIDGDLIRRGTENLIGILAKEPPVNSNAAASADSARASVHWAESCGILMGDLLLADVHQMFARLSVDQNTRVRLLDGLSHTIRDSIAGEILDVGLSDGMLQRDLGLVLEMCGRKTATYTFELPLRAAAALSGATAEVEQLLARVGQHLGLAFQLQDDLLSVFGDPATHGKDAFSDLREGKETAVIAYARTTSAWPSIEPLFRSKEMRERHVADIHALLVSCSAESFVRSLIEDQLRAFRALLDGTEDPETTGSTGDARRVQLPEAAVQVLHSLVHELEGRHA